MSSLSVVVIAYNEVQDLEPTIENITQVVSTLNCPYELIIINDGSSDGTGEAADALAVQYAEIRVIHHEDNRGLGQVYRTGFAAVQKDFVTFFPADGQAPASIIQQFYPLMAEADMILGYTTSGRGSIIASLLSKMEKLLYRLLFGAYPRFQGILMFRRELLDAVVLKSEGRAWTVLIEFIIRVHKSGRYRLVSQPIQLVPRQTGLSKVTNLSSIWQNFTQTILLRIRF